MHKWFPVWIVILIIYHQQKFNVITFSMHSHYSNIHISTNLHLYKIEIFFFNDLKFILLHLTFSAFLRISDTCYIHLPNCKPLQSVLSMLFILEFHFIFNQLKREKKRAKGKKRSSKLKMKWTNKKIANKMCIHSYTIWIHWFCLLM